LLRLLKPRHCGWHCLNTPPGVEFGVIVSVGPTADGLTRQRRWESALENFKSFQRCIATTYYSRMSHGIPRQVNRQQQQHFIMHAKNGLGYTVIAKAVT